MACSKARGDFLLVLIELFC